MCIWKAWKKPKTKVANLIKCGIEKYKACEWGNTRKGYWRIADSPILKVAINNDSLRKSGYPSLMGSYLEWHPKIGTAVCRTARTRCERSVNMKIGDKHL